MNDEHQFKSNSSSDEGAMKMDQRRNVINTMTPTDDMTT